MTQRDFFQHEWDRRLEAETERLVREALAEDSESDGDLTSRALVPLECKGQAAVVARQSGMAAGLETARIVAQLADARLIWQAQKSDGSPVAAGETLGVLSGPARALLAAERPLLNIVGRLSGIASLAALYVEAVRGTSARIYDTRKTTPGWRRLEKYAVRCGGARNHRTGLFDAILIKDNHIACVGRSGVSPAEAVRIAKQWLETNFSSRPEEPIIEIEVDSLEQLENVLSAAPDIVLLDNMSPETMREAVEMRNRLARGVELEASGGINLESVRAKAESGVDRISVGRLTHSPQTLDIGLDWTL